MVLNLNNTISFIFSYFLRSVLSVGLILPLIIFSKYFYKYTIYGLSIYGIYLICYLLIQSVFSVVNEKYNWFGWKLEKIKRSVNVDVNSLGLYNIIVVGRREDICYYTMCLESLKNIVSIHLNKINILYLK